MELAEEFLTTLWPGGLPTGTGVQLWRLEDKKSFTFRALDAAAKFGSGEHDMYVAAGLSARPTAPSKTRLSNEQVVGIPGLWADIDINGGPAGKMGAAPSFDAALELANSVMDPTLIVNSGYGIQGWWLFEEPWVFSQKEEREQASRLLIAFQALLRATAKRMGWTIDPTHDLARVMRLPGTYNCKGMEPVSVTFIESDGPRYDLGYIQDVCKEHMQEALQSVKRVTGEGIEIVLNGASTNPPLLKIQQLKDIDPAFAQAWDHTKPPSARAKWSMSSYEMSIANYLVRAGFTDQEMADCLVYHRLRFEPEDPKGKASRVDYIAATIGKARAGVAQEEQEADREAERDDAVQQLAAMAHTEAPDPVRATSLFTTVVGGPEVKCLVQDGRDPEHAQFRIELADGREVPVGPAANLLNQERFRERFMVVTSYLPKRCKADKWDEVIRALLKTAEVNEEDSRVAIVHGWLEAYMDYNLSNQRDEACQAMDPFESEGMVYVYAGTLNQWLRKARALRLKDTEIHQYLHAAGFERRPVNYSKENGARSQRSYWCVEKEALPFL